MRNPPTREPDTGLICLTMLARFHGLSADPEQIAHRHAEAGQALRLPDLLHAARQLGLHAKVHRPTRERLGHVPLPALAHDRDGRFFVLARIQGEGDAMQAFIQEPLKGGPRWVPVAEWVAGPNWGTHFLPRIGSEVLVEFLHGDIDQPRITGQLYNGEVAPPFGGGIDEKAQHPGVLSGLHTQSHDGGGTQQWVIDDTPGQLRTRLNPPAGSPPKSKNATARSGGTDCKAGSTITGPRLCAPPRRKTRGHRRFRFHPKPCTSACPHWCSGRKTTSLCCPA